MHTVGTGNDDLITIVFYPFLLPGGGYKEREIWQATCC